MKLSESKLSIQKKASSDPSKLDSTQESSWQSWSLNNWNQELFWFVFGSNDHSDDFYINRLVVDDDFFSNLTGEAKGKVHQVREAFISIFKTTPGKFRNLFRTKYATAGWSSGDSIPPFFAQLTFTALVASSTEKTVDEGDFRRRISLELGFQETEQYPFQELAELWEILSNWLLEANRVGMNVQLLQLPDCGHQNRIGYSKFLAFPSRQDLKSLSAVLTSAKISAESPVTRVVRAVAKKRKEFSSAFLDEFDEFLGIFNTAGTDVHRHAFWRAVITASGLKGKTREDEASFFLFPS
jgi:hypothetical protein